MPVRLTPPIANNAPKAKQVNPLSRQLQAEKLVELFPCVIEILRPAPGRILIYDAETSEIRGYLP